MEKFKPNADDPGFLVAKGRFFGNDIKDRQSQEKDHRSKLSNAIYMALSNHGYAHVRAIGTNAIANAVRAIASTSERCQKNGGVSLMWEIAVDKGNLGPVREENHVQDVIAYSFRIVFFENEKEKK